MLIVSAPMFRVAEDLDRPHGRPDAPAAPARRCATRSRSRTSAPTTRRTPRCATRCRRTRRYVAGSTTLNGTPVPDGPCGSSPLVAGIAIYAPEDPTPGAMRADASATPSNVATIVFDVVVDAAAVERDHHLEPGLRERAGRRRDRSAVGRPATRRLRTIRRATSWATCRCCSRPRASALLVDGGTPGIVDPGDVLRYTITVYNNGAVPATGVVLRDARAREHDLRRGLHDAERPAGRAAGRRRLAARRGRPVSSATTRRCRAGRHARRVRSSVRPARERRRAAGHAHQQPGRRATRPSCRTC